MHRCTQGVRRTPQPRCSFPVVSVAAQPSHPLKALRHLKGGPNRLRERDTFLIQTHRPCAVARTVREIANRLEYKRQIPCLSPTSLRRAKLSSHSAWARVSSPRSYATSAI